MPRQRLSLDEIDFAEARLKAGESVAAVAKAMGRSRQSLSRLKGTIDRGQAQRLDVNLITRVTENERATFQVLIATHGIGPALALAILGTHSPSVLVDIVASSDLGALTLVPGVGKKTAERLLIELRNRLNLPMLDPVAGGAGAQKNTVVGDVREALTGLGYAPEEIREALRELPADGDASTLLRDALKVLGAKRA